MGHKVNPIGMRLGIVKPWSSSWYADSKNYRSYLLTDIKVRDLLMRRLASASVSRVHIERKSGGNVCITVHSARPGIVIGKKGEDIEKLRVDLAPMLGAGPLQVKVEEIRKPELDAYLVAEGVAQQIERRVMFRRAMKRAIANAMRIGAEGIKVAVSGRLNGAEIARSEWYREGRIPLHTLRADIDYSCVHAKTTYGVIGVKVWILRGGAEDETPARASKGKPGRDGKRRPGRDADAGGGRAAAAPKEAGKATEKAVDAAKDGGTDKPAAATKEADKAPEAAVETAKDSSRTDKPAAAIKEADKAPDTTDAAVATAKDGGHTDKPAAATKEADKAPEAAVEVAKDDRTDDKAAAGTDDKDKIAGADAGAESTDPVTDADAGTKED